MGRLFRFLLVPAALAGTLFAQNYNGRGNTVPSWITNGFGSVVFPGGTGASMPGVTRTFGNVVFPGGGGPQVTIPPSNAQRVGGYGGRGYRPSNVPPAYVYPIFISGMYDWFDATPQQPAPQPQSITIVYPPQQPAPAPVDYGPPQDAQAQPEPARPEPPAQQDEPETYLLAFKDHSIYSVVAYWVDGDTLHYFTPGNKHNQISLSLVDRTLTKRLNDDTGSEVILPPEKTPPEKPAPPKN